MALSRYLSAFSLGLMLTSSLVPEPAFANNFVRGASGGPVAPTWAVDQTQQMPYTCSNNVYFNPSPSSYGMFGGGSLSANQGGTGTGSASHPFLTLSAAYAGNGNVHADAGTCFRLINSTPLIDDGFEPSLLPTGHQGGDANSPTGYAVLLSVDGSDAPAPAAGPGVTPDTVNTAAAHLIMSACGSCASGGGGEGTFMFFVPPADFWIMDGLNIEGVGGFLSQDYFGCVTWGNAPLVYNAVSGPSHMQVRNSYIHGCGGAGIQMFGNDWNSVQNNVITNTSGAPGFQEFGIGDVVPEYECAGGVFVRNCAPIQTGFDSTIGTILNGQLIQFHKVWTGNWTDGHYEFGQSGTRTDGNCIIDDTNTLQGNQGVTNAGPWTYPTLIANNVALHCGGRGIHNFFSQHIVMLNNTSFANHWDTGDPAIARVNTTCDHVNDCAQHNNIAVGIGGNSTVSVAYTGGSTGPVSVDNVNAFLRNWTGGNPSGATPMPITMQDTTGNGITAVTIDHPTTSTTPGGLSGTVTFSGIVSILNGTVGSAIDTTSFQDSSGASAFFFSFGAYDSVSATVSACYMWIQVALPCTGTNLQSVVLNGSLDAWTYNDWYAIDGAVGAGADGATLANPLPTLASAPGNNLQATDPEFTSAAFTVRTDFIVGQIPNITAPGLSYAAGCVVTMAGGSPTTAAAIKVDTIGAGGAIATYHLYANGFYPDTATTSFTQASVSGCSGSGATFGGIVYYQPFWINSARPTLTLQSGSPAKDAGDPHWCLSQDYAGTKRPCPSSIGAYE